jgi:hypothetical protein
MVPLTWKLPLRLAPKFFCDPCWQFFQKSWRTPIRGLDKPEGADDDWKPSIHEVLRHAQIAIAFEERKERERLYGEVAALGPVPRRVKGFTPAQLKQYAIMRRAFRDLREGRLR